MFEDVVSLILNNYVEDAKVDKVMEGAMRGLADGLDPDSAYLTAAEVKSIDPVEKVPPGDVGIELTRQYYLRVIAARDDSPAAKAGLQTGDYVRAIDGKPARDLSVFEGMRLLRGAPGHQGHAHGDSRQRRRAAADRARPREDAGRRRHRQDAGARSRLHPHRRRSAPDATAKIRAQADDAGEVRREAIRSSMCATPPKGPFETGLDAARLFVKTGTLAMIAGRDPEAKPIDTSAPPKPGEKLPKPSAASIKETITAKPGDGAITLPVTLLVTTGTSGAAELFASALDGNKRAELIGERTLGRAGIQKLVRLPDGRGLWLTYGPLPDPRRRNHPGQGPDARPRRGRPRRGLRSAAPGERIPSSTRRSSGSPRRRPPERFGPIPAPRSCRTTYAFV